MWQTAPFQTSAAAATATTLGDVGDVDDCPFPTDAAAELSPSVGDAVGCCTTDWQVDTPVAHKVGRMLRV